MVAVVLAILNDLLATGWLAIARPFLEASLVVVLLAFFNYKMLLWIVEITFNTSCSGVAVDEADIDEAEAEVD